MITIESAESALRNIYLESVINDINTKTNPFLTMISKNTKTIADKEAKVSVRYGNEANVGVGAEGGTLPAGNTQFAEIAVPLKNLYGTFQITDKAIRAAQNNAGAFAALLSGEMKNLIGAAQANLNRMVYGNGLTYLGYSDSRDDTNRKFTVPVKQLGNFKVGMNVTLYAATNQVASIPLEITAINTNTGEITYGTSGTVYTNKYDRLYVYAPSQTGEMNGIDSLFMTDKLYNLTSSQHKGILPCNVIDNGTTLEILDEEEILKFFDAYEEHCQSIPADILMTHPNVKKALFETLRDTRSNIATADLAGGFKGFTFNGIPLYSDLKCKAGVLYALNSESFATHQLCDWTWLAGDDGSILRQMDGKPVYSATLVKYADLICEKPFLQGKVSGYAANSWS